MRAFDTQFDTRAGHYPRALLAYVMARPGTVQLPQLGSQELVIAPPSGSPCDDAGWLARVLPLRVRRLIAPPCIERFKSPGPTVRRGCQRFRSSTFHLAITGMH
jgi:hypothetical protein